MFMCDRKVGTSPICSIGKGLAEIDDIFGISGKVLPASHPPRPVLPLTTSTIPRPLDQRWDEIERLVAQIADLSQSSLPRGEFAGEVLKLAVEAVQANDGAVWWRNTNGDWTLECQESMGKQGNLAGQDRTMTQSSCQTAKPFAECLDSTAERGRPVWCEIPATAGSTAASVWLAVPLKTDGQKVVGAIGVNQPAGLGETERNGSERLLAIVSDLFGNYLRREELRQLRSAARRWQQYEYLVTRVHRSLDLRTVASSLVNDGRVFLGCDRVSLLIVRHERFQTVAISGVHSFDRRSNQVRELEQVAEAVAGSGQWLQYAGQTAGMPPQVAEPLTRYVDLSHALRMDVIPLFTTIDQADSDPAEQPDDKAVGMLVVESFQGGTEAADESEMTRLACLAAVAVRNANEYGSLPLLSLSRWTRRAIVRSRFRQQRRLIPAAFVVASALAIALIPADVRVDAQGDAWPQIRRDLYAPSDGEVVSVARQHDDRVDRGDTLVVLRSPDLDVEMQRLRGEFQTTQKKLLAIASARLQTDDDAAGNRSSGQLAAEEQELKQLLQSQSKQMDLLRRQQNLLQVKSPIAGRLLTWDPEQKLENRPVERGQRLVTVADESGPWILELTVPELQVRHLLERAENSDEPLAVRFTLAADRATRFSGKLRDIAKRIEVGENRRSHVRVTVAVESAARPHLRPGAAVFAKIHCGRRSVGYVWLDGVVQAIRGWLF